MFRDRDLPVRVLGTALPAQLGYRLSDTLTPLVGGARHRHVSAVAGAAAATLLADRDAGEQVRRRYVTSLAADDLDACRAWAGVGPSCGSAALEGERFLPAPGAAVFVGFHLSGGLAVFEVLRRHGFAPTFLRAPMPPAAGRYERTIGALRLRYLRRALARPWILTGPGARDTLASHLASGGAVVALLDVPAQAVPLRDRTSGSLFGRTLSVPSGLLRLALAQSLPILPFDARVSAGSRAVRFHAPARGADVGAVLGSVLHTLEGVVRERPWDWHSWLELDYLFADVTTDPTAGG